MTDKEILNAILRLRLFYSTEKELGDEVGLKLKGNHFNRLKTFDCEAIFSKFAKECNKMTGGKIDLANLISTKLHPNFSKSTLRIQVIKKTSSLSKIY